MAAGYLTKRLIIIETSMSLRSIQIEHFSFAVWFVSALCLTIITTPVQGSRGLTVVLQTEEGKIIPLYSDSFALVIGASQYTRGWPDLPGVLNDVQHVQSALSDHGFRVKTVVDPDSGQLREAIEAFINRNGNQVNHRLLIYFAGHGHTLKLAYGEEMGYILPTDTPNPNNDRNGFYAKALDMQQIEVYAKRIQSKHVLFVFDSCFSGAIFSLSRAIPENISYKTAKPVRQFLTSGGADETVPDNSVFAQQFVRGLSGEADVNQDGYITGTELGGFLQDTVVNYTRGSQHPQYGKIRNPMLDKGDFVFVNAPQRAASPPATKSHTPSGETQSGDDFELLFWQSIKDSDDPQMFAAYLEKFPQGMFADLARLKIEKLDPVAENHQTTDDAEPQAIAVAPAQPPAPVAKNETGIRQLAIFPGLLNSDAVAFSAQDGRILPSDERQTQFRRCTDRMWEATKIGLQKNPSIKLQYSYYRNDSIRSLANVTLIDNRFNQADREGIWKISPDKTWEPDVAKVCRHARNLDIDLVLLHKLKREKLRGVFAVYLVDVKQGSVHKYQRMLDATLDMETLMDTALRP